MRRVTRTQLTLAGLGLASEAALIIILLAIGQITAFLWIAAGSIIAAVFMTSIITIGEWVEQNEPTRE